MSAEVQNAAPTQQQSGESPPKSKEDEEKQRLLDQKMEEMRRKNEALRKRYEEIEADKRNANLNSKIAGNKDDDDDGDYEDDETESDEESSFPRGPSKDKINRPSTEGQETTKPNKNRARQQPNAATMPYQQSGQNRQRELPPHDAPPPDPKYHFLDDPVRRGEGGGNERGPARVDRGGSGSEFRRSGGNRTSFEAHRGGGGGDFGPGGGRPMGSGRGRGRRSNENAEATGDVGGRGDYNRWREERDRIDAERLARQQTSTGQWKREWDADKHAQRQDDSQRFGDRRNQRPQGGNWHDNDRQQQQRGQFGRPSGGRQDFRNGGNQEYDSRGPSRRVTSAGRGFKVEVHQDQAHRDDGGRSGFGAQPRGRGRGRGSGFDGTSQHQYSVGGSFGSGADGGADHDQDRSFNRPRGGGRAGAQSNRGRPSNEREAPTATPGRKGPTESRLQQEASLDTPSSEYASPEPQLQQPPKEEAKDGNQQWEKADEDEDEQWEDVEGDGGNADGYYYDDLHYGTTAAAAAAPGEGHGNAETGQEDELALAARLHEIEKQVRENHPQPDDEPSQAIVGELQKPEQAASGEIKMPEYAAAAVEAKDISAARRRQTTDGVGGGPELTSEEGQDNQLERARHESMDQIEREMIARMNENILAAEAALGGSEEDLELLLGKTGPVSGAPMLEGADEDELLRNESSEPAKEGSEKTEGKAE